MPLKLTLELWRLVPMEAQPVATETHHRAEEANLGHLEVHPVALEEPGGMESHRYAVKARPVAMEAQLGALMFTLKPMWLTLEL